MGSHNPLAAKSVQGCAVSPALLQRDGVDTSSANVHPCTFADGEFLLCKNVATAWNHGHPCPF